MEDNEDLWKILEALRSEDGHTLDGQTHIPEISSFYLPHQQGAQKCTNPKCMGDKIVEDEGQFICMDCSTVLERVIDSGAEWRFYGAEDSRGDDPTRCGMPTNDLLPKSSLGSMIGGKRYESREIRRIRMYQMWNSMPYWERTLYAVFDTLSQNTAFNGIHGKVLEDAKVLYKQVSEKKISRGDNKEGLIASCVYYSCLLNNVPRSTKEIATMFHIDPVVLTKGNARFQALVKLNVQCSSAEDFINRFGSRLNMDWDDITICKSIAKRLDDLDIISENAPTSIAAGVLYYHIIDKKLDFTKKEVSEITSVSEVTILKCYKRLLKWKDIIFQKPLDKR